MLANKIKLMVQKDSSLQETDFIILNDTESYLLDAGVCTRLRNCNAFIGEDCGRLKHCGIFEPPIN